MMELMENGKMMMWIIFAVAILGAAGWGKNIYKLTQCDFEAPYKAEVVYVIGILPPVGAITGWINVGK